MTFGEKLQYLRKCNGLSQEQLAEHLNISRQAVSRWETGAIPDVENVVKISRYFDCSLDYLLNNEAEQQEAPVQPEPQPQKKTIRPETVALLVALGTMFVVVVLYFVSVFVRIDVSIRDPQTGMYFIGFGKFIQYYDIEVVLYLCAIIWSVALSVRMYFQLFTHGQWKNKKYFRCRAASWCLYLLGTILFIDVATSYSGNIWVKDSMWLIAIYMVVCVALVILSKKVE